MNGRPFGVRLTADGASFRLWAPAAKRVELLLEKPQPMARGDDGWFTADVAGVKAGMRYKYRVDDEIDVPDPASAFQPEDVFGPSEVIDHDGYQWRARDWKGRPWRDTVLIETHVGTFTPEGSYRAMIGKLDHLAATGITALELMPLADFAGQRNWGYDGVLWYAPDSAYGRPEDLKALIDEAHLRGLMVFLDVVYNHFGPDGNYLGRYAPSFFTDAHTPWGSAIDYRLPEVRAFAIENALSWLRDYRFDGLRFDAINHILDEPGQVSVLHDISVAAGKLAAETGRHIHLVLENGDNRASLLDAIQDPPRGKYRAQWNDDYHHAWHVLLTGESKGYYGDYQKSPRNDIARALASGFVYQGETAAFWGGKPRGEPSGKLSPAAFVNFLQNHDQVGNRPLGDRLESLAKPEEVEAALAVTLLAPTCRCCSWASNGVPKCLSPSSAISRAVWPTPSARAGARNLPGPISAMVTRCPIPSMKPRSNPRCSIGHPARLALARGGLRWSGTCSRRAVRRSCPGSTALLSRARRRRRMACSPRTGAWAMARRCT